MNKLPKKLLVDTNVPKLANSAVNLAYIPSDLLTCVLACVEAIEHVVNKGNLVLDAENEIFDEYRKQLSMKGQPGVGDHFIKWVHDNRWNFPTNDRVIITKKGESYEEFPNDNSLKDFDNSDRKFVAVANAHPNKPPILQAADSKWWGWSKHLSNVGIHIIFLCPEYIKTKFEKKIGS